MYNAETGKATGVRVIDAETKETMEFKAKVIFLCASAVASASVLLQSKSERFPDGMGNDSGELGHNLMDHHFRVGASGRFDGFHLSLIHIYIFRHSNYTNLGNEQYLFKITRQDYENAQACNGDCE